MLIVSLLLLVVFIVDSYLSNKSIKLSKESIKLLKQQLKLLQEK